jgi:prevent-host-death family protein
MTVVNMHEAKSQLSKLVARAEAGEDVVIARDGKPAVRLTPVTDELTWIRRIEGTLAGRIWVSDDFDDPLPEFEAAFYDGPIEP